MFTESEQDAVLSLLSLKYAKHHNPNDGLLSINGSTKNTHEAIRLLEIGSHQQTHNASKRISPSNREQDQTG